MRFSEEDLKKQLESTMPGSTASGSMDYGMQQLLSGMASAAQNTMLEGCPVFINRLRENPQLAERIKKMMQEWSTEKEEK
jgi:hypothetical protein